MPNQPPDRLEIFLALAVKSGASEKLSAANTAETTDANFPDDAAHADFSSVFAHLTEEESQNFKHLQTAYQNKSADEKVVWQAEILRQIGTDEHLIDAAVHWSHVAEAWRKESPAVQKIVFESLLPKHLQAIDFSPDKPPKNNRRPKALDKTIRRAFAENFVALRDLPAPTAFDRLSGAQTALLIRLAGIREVALACLQIEAVELVAAFLRRFSAEDANAVAAQLRGLPKMAEARLAFAGNLVKTMLEIESKPAAMLDLLGIHLVGIALCDCQNERVIYTNQKLPLEAAPQLPKIIAEQRRAAPHDLRREISAEVEQTAATIFRGAGVEKP